MRKISFMIFMIFMAFLIVPNVNAFLDTKSYDKETKTYSLNSWAGLNTKMTIQLVENTDVCLINCRALLKVKIDDSLDFTNSNKEDFKWEFYDKAKRIVNIGNRLNNINIKRQYKRTQNYLVDDYGLCEQNNLNGTKNQNKCKIGQHQESKEAVSWEDFDFLKNSFIAGEEFYIELTASKEPEESIEWLPTILGERLDQWAWFSSGYQYKNCLNITNSAPSGMQKNHTINVSIDTSALNTAGKIKADCSDLRVVYNTTTELDRVFMNSTFMGSGTCLKTNETLFFALQANISSLETDNSSYCLYYGNASSGSAPENKSKIWLVYQDCNNANGWNSIGGTVNFNGFCQSGGANTAAQYNFTNTNLNIPMWKLLISFNQSIDNDGYIQFGIEPTGFASGTLDPLDSDYTLIFADQITQGVTQYGLGLRDQRSGVNVKTTNSNFINQNYTYNLSMQHLGSDFPTLINDSKFVNYANTNSTNNLRNSFNGLTVFFNRGSDYIDNILFERALETPPTVKLQNEVSNITSIEGDTRLKSPVNNTNTTSKIINFTCNSSISVGALVNITLYIWNSSGFNFTQNISNISGIVNSTNWTINLTPTANYDDAFQWNCLVSSTASADTFASANSTFIVDTIGPNVNFTAPGKNNAIFNSNSLTLSGNTGDKHGIIAGTDNMNCLITFDQGKTNTTLSYTSCKTGTFSNSATSQAYTNYITEIHVNDTLGNANMTSINYTLINIQSAVFNSTVIEGSLVNFSIIIERNNSVKITPTFVFNGSGNTTNIQVSVNSTNQSETFSIPVKHGLINADITANYSFYWSFNITYNDNSSIFNTTTQTQTVARPIIVICNSTYDVPAVNFTVRYESNYSLLNSSDQDSTFITYTDDIINNRTYSFNRSNKNNLTTFSYCLNPPWSSFKINALLMTSKTNTSTFDTREYFIENQTISNTTLSYDVYLLEAATSTLNIIKIQNEYQKGIRGALVSIQKYDVANDTFRTLHVVKTDNNGEAITQLEWFNVLYRFIVVINGKTRLVTVPAKIAAESITLSIKPEFTFTHDKFSGVDFNLTYNNATSIFKVIYNNPSGQPVTACLKVVKLSFINQTKVCDNCSTQSSAILTCKPSESGTYTATFYGLGSPPWNFGAIQGIVGAIEQIIKPKEGVIIGLLFVASAFILLPTPSPSIAILAFFGSMAAAFALGLQTFSIPLLIFLFAIGVMIIWKLNQ